ncbi:MAG: thioredoxin domain-containing protein [Candidatus Bathyarchaeota archaeon]|nr:MAG: thioredoxin domain-containing protein [Candidatus Bathyarchaeota archaeon]
MSRRTKRSNRLSKEKSPYLLQHARNPVDWFPWGDEAFARAKKENKPIFLSIGYSTCHWCHVMERESFEDLEVAEVLNGTFVSIKVDREERPDIDSVYMKASMLMTGSGGWPLTIIMTPEKKPFFAGTYFPKLDHRGMPGLLSLLSQIAELWKKDSSKFVGTADKITEQLMEYVKAKKGVEEPSELLLDEGFLKLLDSFDRINGGFGYRPKFPTPHNLLFLLRYWKRTGRREALEMVETTLQKMRLGGIFDHVGFGFHRYSTDSQWLVPHFEKMLYDQALLAMAFTEAYQATGKAEYKKTVDEIFTYVLRNLTSAEGGFFSAEDADTEGEEGKFYLWPLEEVKETLGEDADLAFRMFNIKMRGNYADEVHHQTTGKNILHLKTSHDGLSAALGQSVEELASKWEAMRLKLFAIREKRTRPLRDDKILTDWNGLMIVAFAKAAQAFDARKYTKVAEKAANFILRSLRKDENRLLHRYKDGDAAIDGNLRDYAFLIWGLIELYEVSFNVKYLREALRLQDGMIEHFWDRQNGSFFSTADDGENLLIRDKNLSDGALPSSNSVALLNLVRLSRMTGSTEYEKKARLLARVFSSHSEGESVHNSMFLSSLEFLIEPTFEIVLVGTRRLRDTATMLKAIRTRFLPNKVILFKEKDDRHLDCITSFTGGMQAINGKATAYICKNFTCSRPTTSIKEVLHRLTED